MRRDNDSQASVERYGPLLIMAVLAVIAYVVDDWKVLVLAPITWAGSRPG